MPRPKSPVRLDQVNPVVCSLDYRLKIIGRLPFFRHLSHEAIFEINRLFEDCDVTAKQMIYFEGDAGDHLYLVAMGKVKLMRNAMGREVLLDILRGGDYFGALGMAGENYTESAVAQTDGCTLQISTTNFEKILERYPDVTRKILKAVSERLNETQEIIKQLSVYSAEQRIAAALIRLADKWGEAKKEGVLIQLSFSRQDLAAMTGTTVETVSRVMSRFSAEEWISTGRRWVEIHKRSELERIVNEGAVN